MDGRMVKRGRISMLRDRVDMINDRLYSILGSIHDGLYITDGEAETILINRAYEAISGLRPEEVLGRKMEDILRDGLIDQSGTLLALEAREPVTLEQKFRTGKMALISSTPYFDARGEISLVITMVRDMTELYKLQEEFRHNEERYRAELEFIHRHQQNTSRIIAADEQSQEMLRQLRRVSKLDTTLLLLGETGVGKEQMARYVYENSERSGQSFICINCGSIPEALIESELFGYEKGSFTGAAREGKMGVFESADKGTVFLDEIGDLPYHMQVHLLRVLQEMQIRRVGGTRSIPVDVRIIAATNRDLWGMVGEGKFRADLYYRLNVVPIHILPLRERKNDIAPMARSFLAELNKKYQFEKAFSQMALRAMEDYPWPGNVRELKNVVEHAAVLSSGTYILPGDLHLQEGNGLWPDREKRTRLDLKLAVADFEYHYICQAYQAYGTVRAAAESLGMDDATFVRKRKKYRELLQK